MTQASVRTDFHQSLDVHRDFFAKITFDAVILFDSLTNLVGLVVVQLANLDIETDAAISRILRPGPVRCRRCT
jgi:hypothetical protein